MNSSKSVQLFASTTVDSPRELAEAMAVLDVIRMQPKQACACWQ